MKEYPSQEKEIALRDMQAATYDETFVRTRGNFGFTAPVKTVLSPPHPLRSDDVLDAGCGTGVYTMEIAKRAHHVHSVDFSPESIGLLNQRIKSTHIKNVTTSVSDLAVADLPLDSFTKAIAVEVIQHIPTPEKRLRVLRNILGSLKGGGKLLMVVYRYGGWFPKNRPQEEHDHGGVGLYRRAFTPEECRELLEEADFIFEYASGVLNLHRKIRKRLPPSMAFIEVAISKLGFSRRFGDYLIVSGRKQGDEQLKKY